MGLLTGLIKIMLEHRAGPGRVIEEVLSPTSNPVADSRDNEVQEAPSYSSENQKVRDCTSCGGTGEDKDRYEPMFDVYCPCSTCHGKGYLD